MLWVLIRIALPWQFQWVPTWTYVFMENWRKLSFSYLTSRNNVAPTDFDSWSELQHDAIPANDAKQEFWWETQIMLESWEIKCFSSVFFFKIQIILNPYFALKCTFFKVCYVLMHLRGVVLVCGVSMVTDKVWNKIFTMKSTRTGSYRNTLKYLYFIGLN